MSEYQKIPGPFLRDPVTNKLTREWSTPEIAALKDTPWNFTEKIDGTNIRIYWDGYRVSIKGRTDKAIIPDALMEALDQRFLGPDNETLFEQQFGDTPAILYGEGYGPKIQGGGKYSQTHNFALFDVRINNLWLNRGNVVDVAEGLGCEVVPLVFTCTLPLAIEVIESDPLSEYGDFECEGVVGVTSTGLLDRRGNRIAVKVKNRDFR